jgi:mRNA-degrading endonuclease YafQ of YafQ-DinJ toxin-antitoxin module
LKENLTLRGILGYLREVSYKTGQDHNPLNPLLKTHGLSDRLKGLWAISISYEHRLIFKFISSNKILLIDIGTHDEVY